MFTAHHKVSKATSKHFHAAVCRDDTVDVQQKPAESA